jgi:hypothetical protein
MSAETVGVVIRKAVDDEEFRALLISNSEEALAGFDLTEEERKELNNLDMEFFEAEDLEERISRWGNIAGGGI